jgi:N-methylhydantoinase B
MLCAATNILAYDQMGCPSGVLRHLRFDPTPGTFNCAVHPAAVTTLNGTLAGSVGAGQVLSNMVLSGPPVLHGNARTVGGGTSHGLWSVTWTEKGAFMANMTGDTVASAIGASGARDGVDQGGPWLTPTNVAGDVEEWEDAAPLLYLYRQSAVDSGGVGRYRGGNGLDTAFTSHKAEDVHGHMHGSDAAINLEHGLSGGFPGRSGDYTIVADSNVQSLFAASKPPASPRALKELLGTPTRLHARAIVPMAPKDVLLIGHPAGGGVGDPLLRRPQKVADDVINGEVSVALARRAYGVAFDADGNVDAAATEARRAQLRAERLKASAPEVCPQPARSAASNARIRPVGASLIAVGDRQGWNWGCAHCRRLLGPLADNYKLACRVVADSPQKIDAERFPDPKDFSDADMVARQFLCPGCGTLLAFEFCLRDDPPLHEIRIDEQWLQRHADDPAAKPLAAE